MSSAGTVKIGLDVESAKLVKGLNLGARSVKRFTKKATDDFSLFSKSTVDRVNDVFDAFTNITGTIDNFTSSFTSISKEAKNSGVALSDFLGIAASFKYAGGDVSNLTGVFTHMKDAIADAKDGTATYVDALKKLNISIKQISALDTAEQFKLITKRIAEMTDANQQSLVSSDLLSGSFEDVRGVFNEHGGDVDKLTSKLSNLGLVTREETVKAFTKLGKTLGNLGVLFTNVIADGLVPAADFTNDLAKSTHDLVSNYRDVIILSIELLSLLGGLGVVFAILKKVVKPIFTFSASKIFGKNFKEQFKAQKEYREAFKKAKTFDEFEDISMAHHEDLKSGKISRSVDFASGSMQKLKDSVFSLKGAGRLGLFSGFVITVVAASEAVDNAITNIIHDLKKLHSTLKEATPTYKFPESKQIKREDIIGQGFFDGIIDGVKKFHSFLKEATPTYKFPKSKQIKREDIILGDIFDDPKIRNAKEGFYVLKSSNQLLKETTASLKDITKWTNNLFPAKKIDYTAKTVNKAIEGSGVLSKKAYSEITDNIVEQRMHMDLLIKDAEKRQKIEKEIAKWQMEQKNIADDILFKKKQEEFEKKRIFDQAKEHRELKLFREQEAQENREIFSYSIAQALVTGLESGGVKGAIRSFAEVLRDSARESLIQGISESINQSIGKDIGASALSFVASIFTGAIFGGGASSGGEIGVDGYGGGHPSASAVGRVGIGGHGGGSPFKSFNDGGIVKGHGSMDRVPALLTAGEIVINPRKTDLSQLGSKTTNITYNINAVDSRSFQQLVAEDPSFIHNVAEQGKRDTTRLGRF